MNGMKNIVEVFPILRSSEEGGPGNVKNGGPRCQGLRDLPCSEMQFLSMPLENLLLEPIGMNYFLPRHELSTEDDREPLNRLIHTVCGA
jgi:hypothetical protein